ncbi:dTMP kinase [Carnobacteriaceae bacterium zg-84]|uniref:dTMP kinase n=1 Tax=Granulicatella sp. zg-84 TaxID=2678503 RepID=UPI0013C15389|nr:dTMP kinase [Granulicatella sp. zg-84]NEW65618.1 dTMP kinase [Granulicatella sp. zg-84]QMI85741.1 dTMP kinase [Carnobacteriaceae bacterium zg-84]
MSGVFITVEGADGAGKTTLIQKLVPKLKQEINVPLLSTREPGGNVIAEKIREVILNPDYTQMDARTEALLYAAARRQHLVDNLLPALAENKCIICDRFVDSSIAYQGRGRQIGAEDVWQINAFAIDGHQPDLTLYIDVPIEEGLNRIHHHRMDEINRLDMEGIAFHQRVHEGYEELVKEYPNRIVVVDGMQSPQEVLETCYRVIKQRFPHLFEAK